MKQLDPKAVWLFFIRSFFGWLVTFLIIGWWMPFALSEFFQPETMSMRPLVNAISFIILLILIFSFVYSKLSYHYYRYELTDLVFKKEHGIIWKKYVSIPYDRIQNVDIYRGVWARILGLSDIQIQTAGGITAGSYGAFSEGRLVGISKEDAEKLRDELIQRSRNSRNGQGL